jgi:hypothetical protein
VVLVPPSLDPPFRLIQIVKPAGVQAFVAQPSVEQAPHITVWHRSSWLNVHQRDAPFFAPADEVPAGQLRSVVRTGSPSVCSVRSITLLVRRPRQSVPRTAWTSHKESKVSDRIQPTATLESDPAGSNPFTPSAGSSSCGVKKRSLPGRRILGLATGRHSRGRFAKPISVMSHRQNAVPVLRHSTRVAISSPNLRIID